MTHHAIAPSAARDLDASASPRLAESLVARVLRETAAGPAAPALVMEVFSSAGTRCRADLDRIWVALGTSSRRSREMASRDRA